MRKVIPLDHPRKTITIINQKHTIFYKILVYQIFLCWAKFNEIELYVLRHLYGNFDIKRLGV